MVASVRSACDRVMSEPPEPRGSYSPSPAPYQSAHEPECEERVGHLPALGAKLDLLGSLQRVEGPLHAGVGAEPGAVEEVPRHQAACRLDGQGSEQTALVRRQVLEDDLEVLPLAAQHGGDSSLH